MPQLLMPFAHYQFDNAERVRWLACGWILRRCRLAKSSLAMGIDTLLANDPIATIARRESRFVRAGGGATRAAEESLPRFG